MKKNNLIISGGAVLVAIVAISGIVFTSQASENEISVRQRGMRPELSEEDKATWQAEAEVRRAEAELKRVEMDKIFQTGDYNAWVAQKSDDCPMKDKVNAENFDRFAEAHNLKNEGRKILEEEFGFTGKGKGIHGGGKGMRNGGFHKMAK